MSLSDYWIQDFTAGMSRASLNLAAVFTGVAAIQAHMAMLPDVGRTFEAAQKMFDRGARNHGKPAFGLSETIIGASKVKVSEETSWERDFCRLIHFQRETDRKDPKVLLVAPMSGHYATLLRGTVEALLPHHDVYVTDWANARDIPAEKGDFGLSDYVTYIEEMIDHLGPATHVIGVCQPTVPILAAVSRKAERGDFIQPVSMTLMGGPIDTRVAPTEVTRFAENHSLGWFKEHALSRVPMGYPGHGRMVYPGFKQLAGFMAMNADRHVRSHQDMFDHLRRGDGESAAKIGAFYDEYLSVMDLPARFYLETVDNGFIRHLLPKGELTIHNQLVNPAAVRRTALFTVEGEKDDISAPGQTEAAHRLCNNIARRNKFHYLQAGAGHYGIFEGRRWREEICPRVAHFVRTQGVDNGLKYSEIPPNTRLIPPNLWGFSAPSLERRLTA